MGEVYLAEDVQLDRKVALKFLPLHLCQDADCRARFMREALAAAKLNHPNIVTIHEVGDFSGRPYFVAEYVGEQTLRDIIGHSSLDPSDAINIIIQVCEGLQEAHSAGVVHRDIKPSNIVFEKRHHPKIVDFGLAIVPGVERLTRAGSTLGTMSYMSPEQIRGNSVDHRTDLFSLGIVLYELVTGRNPFAAEYEAAIQYRVLSEVPEPLARFKTGVPDGLQEIVDRALEKDPNTRYQSAADMAAELRRLRRRSADSGGKTKAEQPAPPSGRRWLKYSLAVAGAVVLATIMWLTSDFLESKSHLTQKSLAVLPFANLGDVASGQAFCDGLVETISSKLTQLTEFSGTLQVVPASEVRGRDVRSVVQARNVFGVDMAVTGGVQVRSADVRLTLNLVDGKSQRQVRSVIVDQRMDDISRLQDSIVIELAQMLDIQLVPDARRMLAVGRTSSSTAYYSFLRGRGFLQRYENSECLDSAAALFRTAIQADSGYALAYAGLGDIYFQRYVLTMDVQWVSPAVAYATKALDLNDHLAPVLVTLGSIHRMRGQYEEAARYLRQALQIDSMSNESYRELALTYEKMGRDGDAETCYLAAIRLYPGDWRNMCYLSLFYVNRGRKSEALRQATIAESLAPYASYPSAFLGGVYAYLGMNDRAKSLLQQAIRIEPNYFDYSNLGAIYQLEKDYPNAAEMYERALRLRSSDYRVWINLAQIYELLPNSAEKRKVALDSSIAKAELNRKINPDDPNLLVHLADCYAEVGEYDKSLDLVGHAVRLAPNDREVQIRAGLVCEALGKRDLALAAVGRAVDIGYPIDAIRNLDELHELVRDPAFDSIQRRTRSAQSPINR